MSESNTPETTTAKQEAPAKAEKPVEKAPAAKAEETTKPAEAAAKKPMDPKKKKTIIIWSVIGGVVGVAALASAIILIPMLTRVDYKETYSIASQINSFMDDFYYDYDDCVDVVEDADDDWVGVSSYSSYVSDCKSILTPANVELVKKLSQSSGVQRDEEIKLIFSKFATEFNKAVPSVDADLSSKLDIYDSWHKFIYYAVDMSFYSNDASKINTYADYAINSGNDTLKAFGESWKEKALDVAAAYKAYDEATSDYSGLYSTYTTKRDELDDWMEANLPKVTELIPLSFEDNAWEIDDAWEDAYDAIYNKFLLNGASDLLKNNNSTDYEKILEDLLK